MNLKIAIAIAGAILAASAGLYYFVFVRSQHITQIAPPPEVIVVQGKASDEELNKRRAEGIGSIKQLERVDLGTPPANQKHK
jgi:hypothetical protein